jgi:hypothetical protein
MVDNENEWVKLVKKSDWGSLYYTLPDLGPPNVKGSHKVLHAFDQIEIRWPDGTEEVVNITTKSFYERVNDMGNEYTAHSMLPVIISNHHGIEVLVEFQQVEIRRRCLRGPGVDWSHPDPDDDNPDDGERAVA